jgi:hypothetical protein
VRLPISLCQPSLETFNLIHLRKKQVCVEKKQSKTLSVQRKEALQKSGLPVHEADISRHGQRMAARLSVGTAGGDRSSIG